jgi:hypothetical protein
MTYTTILYNLYNLTMIDIGAYFLVWKQNVDYKRYDDWCALHQEKLTQMKVELESEQT